MLLVSQLLCLSKLLSSSVCRMLTRNVQDKVDALLADDEIGPLQHAPVPISLCALKTGAPQVCSHTICIAKALQF